MNLRFTGRHVGIPPEDLAWAEEKLGALARYHHGLRDLEVRVTMDGTLLEKVEIEARYGRRRAVAVGEARTFRAALDGACDSLRHRLQTV